MNDEPAKPSIDKPGKPGEPARSQAAARPQLVLYAAVALGLSGLFSVAASLSLFGGATNAPNGWYYQTAKKANDKLYGSATKHKKGYITDLAHHIASAPKQLLITSLVVLLALAVLAAATYAGKYWARWTTLGLWVMATITGTLAGIGSLLLVTAADIHPTFKIPAFLSALLFLVAVVLVNLRPSVEFFKLNRPVRPAATAAPARRGLFAPRDTTPASTRAATPAAEKTSLTKAAPDRARSKARANSEAAAKGAELARARAKASKSRRTGV
ncbi:MAG: hypothetical protein ACR2LX_08110 [Jatrophihabitans sp.]